MARTATVNWDAEIAALRDMCVTACESHRIAADALWDGMAAASQKENGALEQKVLTAKIAAEQMNALEDLGALGWSIANRHDEGILRRYLNYEPKNVHRFYQRVQDGQSLRDILNLPNNDVLTGVLNEGDLGILGASLAELQKVFAVAAKDYLALDGQLVNTYNKIKHGFVIVQRLDWLIVGKEPPTNWRQHVNVITGITRTGSVRYTGLEGSLGMLQALMGVIKMCGAMWKELASLVIWLYEHEVPLGST